MTEKMAREILADYIDERDNGLFCCGHYLAWTPGETTVRLDDDFEADELEAIVWWMRNIKAAQ